jgi:uncharacterized protein
MVCSKGCVQERGKRAAGHDAKSKLQVVFIMKIPIKHLHEGLHTFAFKQTAAACGLMDHPNLSDVDIIIDVEKSSPHFFIKNRVRATGRFVCDRCLDEFTRAVEEQTSVVFSSAPEMVGLASEEIHPLAKDAVEIDITDDVRDALLLALPVKAVCRPDCKGICPHCGAELNKEICRCGPPHRDARWAALDKFLEKS